MSFAVVPLNTKCSTPKVLIVQSMVNKETFVVKVSFQPASIRELMKPDQIFFFKHIPPDRDVYGSADVAQHWSAWKFLPFSDCRNRRVSVVISDGTVQAHLAQCGTLPLSYDISANVFLQSLVKSSWESRVQPTIIPQGVPYMVKLLRYYVSEDAVYLHLEHVKGQLLI